jgi:AraC-like DNA-binding protein
VFGAIVFIRSLGIDRMMKKSLLYLLAPLFFIPLVLPIKSELVMFPGKKNYKLHAFNDVADSAGNSLSSVALDTGKAIVFDYTLRKHPTTEKTPFAGIVMTLTESDSFVDISSYDSLCIDIITKQVSSFKINLKTFINGYTVLGEKKENFITYHYEQCEVMIHLGETHYSKSLTRDFRIPEFMIPYMKGLPLEPNNTKLFSMDFQSGSGALENVPAQFKISKIAFVKGQKKNTIALLCAIFSALYCLIITLLLVRTTRGKTQSAPPPAQQPVSPAAKPEPPDPIVPDMPLKNDEEAERLEKYIGDNYQEPELTVEQVGHGAGITPVRVTGILQQKYNMTFKQYLNDIRIKAAKQLLVKSDRTIAEIAFEVGYNNIPHFNRVFREIVGDAPGNFRETQMGTI